MTKAHRPYFMIAILLGAFAVLAAVAPVRADDREDLKARFKARYAALSEAKDAGKVGETYEGYVDAVVAGIDDKVRGVIADENADRRELYKMIAEKEKISPDQVAKVNAQRRYDREPAGRFWKGSDGEWKKKG